MKKKFRFTSLTLVFLLIFSVFGGTAASAADQDFIQFPDGFQSVTELNKSDMKIWEVTIPDPTQTLTVTSSDADVLDPQLDETEEGSGNYLLTVFAWEAGEATLTITASNGASVSHSITVTDKPVQRDYTLTSDTTSDFSIVQGNSYTLKLHYVAGGSAPSTPTLMTYGKSKVLAIRLFDVDSENHDYFYRVDAVGDVGQSADLYMTNLEYVPEKLCTVKITAGKNLKLDTNASTIYKAAKPEFSYTCNVGDTYRFVAYTNSATAPKVSTSNGWTSASYVGKVPGGYEYRMKALDWGDSVVRVTLNGEMASFPVYAYEEAQQPFVKSDTPKSISLEKGKSYTFKFTIMGGGEPSFTAGTGGVVSIQTVKKEGIDYFVKVTGVGKAQTGTSLNITFPQSGRAGFDQNAAVINLTQPKTIPPKSDTNSDFSVKQGLSYTFKITGAASFNAGTAGVFTTEKVGASGNDVFYRITAIGKPGQQVGFYMAAKGQQQAQKVCAVTVGLPAPIVSDTNADFRLAKNASYQFKLTAPGAVSVNFGAGTSGVFRVAFVKRVGSDFYYRITAIGRPGDASGIYTSLPGQDAKKLCIVSVA